MSNQDRKNIQLSAFSEEFVKSLNEGCVKGIEHERCLSKRMSDTIHLKNISVSIEVTSAFYLYEIMVNNQTIINGCGDFSLNLETDPSGQVLLPSQLAGIAESLDRQYFGTLNS